jgi:hypothetical protein
LLSIGGEIKDKLLNVIQKLDAAGWELHTTEGTHDYLARQGIASRALYKASEGILPNVKNTIANKNVDLIINIPNSRRNPDVLTDGYTIRRLAIDHNIPLITNLQIAELFLHCLVEVDLSKAPIKSWREYVHA